MAVSPSNLRKRRKRHLAAERELAAVKSFIWYRDQPHREYVPYGSLGGYEYSRQYDALTGKYWLAHTRPSGEIHMRKRTGIKLDKDGNRVMVEELRYSEYQYDLMRVSLWLMTEHGWNSREIYALLTGPELTFGEAPGQTPLSTRKIASWRMMHGTMKRKGLLWP